MVVPVVVDAPRLPVSFDVDALDLRIFQGHPDGSRSAGSCKIHVPAKLRYAIHYVVEPAKFEAPLLRLLGTPGEDADGERVASSQLNQPEVLIDDFGMAEPLIRIIIATVQEVWKTLYDLRKFHISFPDPAGRSGR